MDTILLGELIKNKRKEKGLTQTELGNRLGLKKAAISKYEKGQILNIPLEMRLKLSLVLDIPLEKLDIDKSFYVDKALSDLYGGNTITVLNYAELANSAILNLLKEVHKTTFYPVIERNEYWLIDKSAYTENDIQQIKYLINTFLLSQISDTEFQQIKTYINFVLSQRENTPHPK